MLNMQNIGAVFGYTFAYSADDNTLNVHISKLRKKLKECNPDIDYIENVWDVVYRIKK